MGAVARYGSGMDRVPEPELMDDAAQAAAYAGADFSEPHERFVTALRERFPELPKQGFAIDLGCGPADVTLRFARAFPGWIILGVDGSPAMLGLGREAVARENLRHRVRFLERRLPDELPELRPADLVFSNSLLHHLADPLVLWRTAVELAAPGAAAFVMDLSRPPSPEAARSLVNRYAADEPEILRRDFHASLLAAYEIAEVEAQLAAMDLALAVEAVSDRHWIAWGRLSKDRRNLAGARPS